MKSNRSPSVKMRAARGSPRSHQDLATSSGGWTRLRGNHTEGTNDKGASGGRGEEDRAIPEGSLVREALGAKNSTSFSWSTFLCCSSFFRGVSLPG